MAGANGRSAEGGFIFKPPSSQYYFFFFSDGITPLQGVRVEFDLRFCIHLTW